MQRRIHAETQESARDLCLYPLSSSMTTKGLTTLVKKVDFPVYGLDFTVNDDIVAVGGGGSGRSGVKNKLVPATGNFEKLPATLAH